MIKYNNNLPALKNIRHFLSHEILFVYPDHIIIYSVFFFIRNDLINSFWKKLATLSRNDLGPGLCGHKILKRVLLVNDSMV